MDFITIKGKEYSTSLTKLDLCGLDLVDEDIIPLEYMVNLESLSRRDQTPASLKLDTHVAQIIAD